MSIIGHSIQNAIANVHAALKQQNAGQAAQSEEEARRLARVRREEEEAREAVRETQEAHENAIRHAGERERKGGRRRDDGREEADVDAMPERPGANLDLFA